MIFTVTFEKEHLYDISILQRIVVIARDPQIFSSALYCYIHVSTKWTILKLMFVLYVNFRYSVLIAK